MRKHKDLYRRSRRVLRFNREMMTARVHRATRRAVLADVVTHPYAAKADDVARARTFAASVGYYIAGWHSALTRVRELAEAGRARVAAKKTESRAREEQRRNALRAISLIIAALACAAVVRPDSLTSPERTAPEAIARPAAGATASEISAGTPAAAAPDGTMKSSLRFTFEQWSATVRTAGKSQTIAIGARAQADLRLPGGRGLYGRVDGSALPGSDGKNTVNLSDLRTVQAIEAYLGAWQDVYGPCAATVFGGAQAAVDAGQIGLGGKTVTWGSGVLCGNGTGREWVLVGAGRHAAAAPGVKLLLTGEYPLTSGLSVVVDAVLGRGGYVRVGPAIRIGSSGQ